MGQQAAPAETAGRLWRSFLEVYATYSLHPLEPQALDAKAREVLLRTAGPRFRSWKADDRPTLPELAAALTAQDASVSEFSRIEKTVEAMLPEIDTYGSYRTAADVSQLREALRQNSGKIHMTLDRTPDGEYRCYPIEGGPAEAAGVTSGAVLLAVDGAPVKGKTLDAIKLSFVGPAGAPVRVKIVQIHGKTEELSIVRIEKTIPNISVTKEPLGVTVRIRQFESTTGTEVKRGLEAVAPVKRLYLDLRGNGGGPRDEALKIASLFFPKETVLGVITTREGESKSVDGNDVLVPCDSIHIIQDERSASATEFLIAVLKEGLPGKVTITGKKTYGKSHSTVRVALEGGGELSVTEALLAPASGKSWDKTGILPDDIAGKTGQ